MTDDETKGGRLARQAAMLCHDEAFRLYLDRRRRAKFHLDIADGTHTECDARDFLITACGINSRAELDHNPAAAARFRKVMHYYRRYRMSLERQ